MYFCLFVLFVVQNKIDSESHGAKKRAFAKSINVSKFRYSATIFRYSDEDFNCLFAQDNESVSSVWKSADDTEKNMLRLIRKLPNPPALQIMNFH